MQEEFIKHMIKIIIDNTNWWPKIKKDLKLIVDVSNSIDEIARGFVFYLYGGQTILRY